MGFIFKFGNVAVPQSVFNLLHNTIVCVPVNRDTLCNLGKSLLKETSVKELMKSLSSLYSLCWDLISQWGVHDKVCNGVLPTSTARGSGLSTDVDTLSNRLYVHWPREDLGHDFLPAVQRMLRKIREEGRQPTEAEYFVTHLGYLHISHGGWGVKSEPRPLGNPGFRPHTQTYMSLTDPGDGHVLGTTRFCDWLQGAIVHVEHLERPNHLPRENIESYRIPSIIDFARVRLHVGSSAPTTYFVGRAVKDSGNFHEDFLKVRRCKRVPDSPVRSCKRVPDSPVRSCKRVPDSPVTVSYTHLTLPTMPDV